MEKKLKSRSILVLLFIAIIIIAMILFFVQKSNKPKTISVLYPNGNEIFTVGQPITLLWTSSTNFSKNVKVEIEYTDGGYGTGRSMSFFPGGLPFSVPNKGSYDTTIPNMNPAGQNWPFGGKHYKVRICNDDRTICDVSDDFFTLK